MLKQLEKEKAWKVGLLQALGVAIYCGLVATFMSSAEHLLPNRPGIAGAFLMLSILVFSAAVSGTLVFAYPAYLAFIKNKQLEAFKVLSFMALFSLVFIVSTVLFIIGVTN